MSAEVQQVRAEIRDWFFNIYIPYGISAMNGDHPDGAHGFLRFWGRPLLLNSEQPNFSGWLMTDEQVYGVMKAMTDKLVASGYRNTVVPDSRIFVYNRTGGAIEVIWSRRDGDGKEVQRIVVQFNVAKLDNDWRFVAVHSRVTDPAKDKDSLDLAWEQ
jgi:uncharacterized NTF2-like protein DUF6841